MVTISDGGERKPDLDHTDAVAYQRQNMLCWACVENSSQCALRVWYKDM
jgi:hypothetical protein